MAFNLEDKVTYNELAPSLQEMIGQSVSAQAFAELSELVKRLNKQLNGNRISIVSNLGNITNPVPNKELAFNVTNNQLYSYTNAWIPSHAVYA